jgi:undecaprenyl-diphosphatase
MNYFDALILGLLQGLTEFLPISSSGHLVLGEYLLGLRVAELKSFDVLVHVGSLLAVLVYFRHDVWEMLMAFWRLLKREIGWDDPYARLILCIIIGTIPAVIVGLFGGDLIDEIFRNPKYVGGAMFIVGLIFVIGETVYKKRDIRVKDVSLGQSVFIGIAQAIALIPGVSRSGSTIVSGLFMGVERSYAARFSFLLGIPAIFGAALLTFSGSANTNIPLSVIPAIIGFIGSFFAGLAAISFLMKFLRKHTLIVFAVYLLTVGMTFFF